MESRILSLCFAALFLLCNPVFSVDISVLQKKLLKHTRYLVKIDKPRNRKNIKSLNKAADYIKKEFSTYSKNIEEQKFNFEKKEFKNIICVLNPKNKKRVVIGAHYDVLGEQPGADDNASGVAALIEIGRLLSSQKSKYRIELVAYSLEELDPDVYFKNMGSYFHAKTLKDKKINIEFMICLDTIGYYSDKKNSQMYPSDMLKLIGGDVGNFAAIIGRTEESALCLDLQRAMQKKSKTKIKQAAFPELLHQGGFSDHMNYWKFGYKGLIITDTAFFRNRNIHKNTDTIEKLNFKIISEIVTGLSEFLIAKKK